MGRRGPPPKPTKLKLLSGNAGKRPLNPNEPEPEVEIPEIPEHLGEEARREWERISTDLADVGLLTRIDRAALAAYCQAWARWVEAEGQLKKFGVIVKSPNGYPMQSPLLAIANKALEQMRKFLTEFGMTPASRTRIHANPDSRGGSDLARKYGLT